MYNFTVWLKSFNYKLTTLFCAVFTSRLVRTNRGYGERWYCTEAGRNPHGAMISSGETREEAIARKWEYVRGFKYFY